MGGLAGFGALALINQGVADSSSENAGGHALLDLRLGVADGAAILAALAAVVLALGLTGRSVFRGDQLDPRSYAKERLWTQLGSLTSGSSVFVGVAVAASGVDGEGLAGRIPLVLLSGVIAAIAATAPLGTLNLPEVEQQIAQTRIESEIRRYARARKYWTTRSWPRRRRHIWIELGQFVGLQLVLILAVVFMEAGGIRSARALLYTLLLAGMGCMVSLLISGLAYRTLASLVDRSAVNATLWFSGLVVWAGFLLAAVLTSTAPLTFDIWAVTVIFIVPAYLVASCLHGTTRWWVLRAGLRARWLLLRRITKRQRRLVAALTGHSDGPSHHRRPKPRPVSVYRRLTGHEPVSTRWSTRDQTSASTVRPSRRGMSAVSAGRPAPG